MSVDDAIDTMVSRAIRPPKAPSRQKSPGPVGKKGWVPKVPQPDFEDSDEWGSADSRGRGVMEEKLSAMRVPPEAMSDSDSCSLFEYVPQSKNR